MIPISRKMCSRERRGKTETRLGKDFPAFHQPDYFCIICRPDFVLQDNGTALSVYNSWDIHVVGDNEYGKRIRLCFPFPICVLWARETSKEAKSVWRNQRIIGIKLKACKLILTRRASKSEGETLENVQNDGRKPSQIQVNVTRLDRTKIFRNCSIQ